MQRELNILKNYILYFLVGFLICFVGLSNVFAEFNYVDIGNVLSTTELQVDSDSNQGSPISLQPNVTYSLGGVREARFIVSYNFRANTNYQFETRLNNVEFDNADTYYVTGYNNEECIISYENSLLNDEYPYFAFQCPHSTTSVVIGIYDSQIVPGGAHNTLWSGTYNFMWSKALLRSSSYSLDGNNYDTDKIIDNQNENTQNIINNQNENTQKEIDSQKVCKNTIIDKNDIKIDNKYLNINGNEQYNTGFGITDFVELSPTSIVILKVARAGSNVSTCFYNSNKEKISCQILNDNPSVNSALTLPTDTKYIKFSINKNDNNPQYEITNVCMNGNQGITESIDDLNDTLTDDNISGASSEASDFFSGFSTNTFGLTSIVTAPLNLIQSITSQTCSSLHLPLPYLNNKYLDLPCMSTIYSNYFGSFFTMYQTITYGIIAYWVIVRIFNQVKDFKNPEHDEIEVMDL